MFSFVKYDVLVFFPLHVFVMYRNDERIVAIDYVTSFHPLHIRRLDGIARCRHCCGTSMAHTIGRQGTDWQL